MARTTLWPRPDGQHPLAAGTLRGEPLAAGTLRGEPLAAGAPRPWRTQPVGSGWPSVAVVAEARS